jgi:hypothetical protein
MPGRQQAYDPNTGKYTSNDARVTTTTTTSSGTVSSKTTAAPTKRAGK